MNDPRLSDHWVKRPWAEVNGLLPLPADTQQVAIVSYPDDEGVRLNKGRAGASEGPDRILYYLGRMVHRDDKTPPILVVLDSSRKLEVEKRHQEAFERVRKLLALNFRVITLGGGHDYGYPDAAAYYEECGGKILNIDAHLDVRPVVDSRLNSGTPFFRFIQKFGGHPLIEWGIQRQCNALSHLKFAKQKGVKVFDQYSRMPKISGPVGLSICLDAFSNIRGVSAPTFTGLSTQQGIEAVASYGRKSQWLGLYECAPKYDPLNEDSARFAALLAYEFMHL